MLHGEGARRAGTPPRVAPGTVDASSPGAEYAVPRPSVSLSQAMEILGTRDLADAQHLARIELRLARECPVCRRVLRQAPMLGPEFRAPALLERLAPWERDEHSVRLIAAWVVLHGW